jgi:hypothetical protein
MTSARARNVAWVICGTGVAGAALGWLFEPAIFPAAWLTAMFTWLGWPLGCMALLLIHAMTGGRWGDAIRPQLLAGLCTLVLLPIVAVPFLVVLPRLYPWLHEISSNHFYLNLPFFAARGAGYCIVWLGLAATILRISSRSRPIGRVAAPGLLLLAVTVSFAAIDWTMSLDPKFNSSVYGMMVGTDDTLRALSISLLMAVLAAAVARDLLDDLGRLLLGLAVLWAYLDFVQLLIVWQSDLASDAPWYVLRLSGGWGAIAAIIAAMHFVLPFFLLLNPALRRNPLAIVVVCATFIAADILRGWWLVLPAAARLPTWVDLAAMTGIGGGAAAIALGGWSLPTSAPAAPAHD